MRAAPVSTGRSGAGSPTRRQRLLILTASYPDAESPINGIFIRDQAEVLGKIFDVLVYFVKVVPLRPIVSSILSGSAAPQVHADDGVPIVAGVYHGRPDARRPVANRVAYLHWRRSVGAALRAWGGRPDVIHAHVALPAGWLAVKLGKDLRVPVILTEHTGPFSALLSEKGARGVVEDALTGPAALLAVSPALASSMRREFPDIQPQVLGNVVRTDFFTVRTREPSSSFRFAALALMVPGKGLEVLLSAARMLLDCGCASFHISIGGDGPERAKLERLSSELGLDRHVDFAGLLTRPQVRSLLQQADVFVLPSLGETFGVAMAEAMACGKPVIATRCGGPEFVVGPGDGILVAPDDPEALASAMRDACEGKFGWSATAIRDSVERRFGPAAFQAALLKIYDRVLAARSG